MKAKNMVFFLTAFFVFSVPQIALANQPPGPQAALAEILILPIMMLLSLVGGGYVVLRRMRGKKSPIRIPAVLGAILAILFSGAHEGYAVIVALIFGIIALVRGLQMISWGLEARSGEERSEYLREANPLRLIVAGSVLVPVTLLLAGMPFAFNGYFPYPFGKELVKFVAYQLAYAHFEESRTGERRFRKITKEDLEFCQLFSMACRRSYVDVDYDADGKSFTVYMLPPHRFPFFPYNYFTSQPSYRADETGQIRMVYVHKRERCPADAPVVLQIDRDILKALRDGDGYVRKSVADALGMVRDPRAVKPLIDVLADEDSEVRRSAAYALGKLQDPRAVEPLIAALQDKDWGVRGWAADALGNLKDPRALEPLITALQDDDPTVVLRVAHALEEWKDPRVVQLLIAGLQDENRSMRRGVAYALGNLEDPLGVEPLIAALRDENEEVRRNAVYALKSITGQNFGPYSGEWQKWWDQNKKTFRTNVSKGASR